MHQVITICTLHVWHTQTVCLSVCLSLPPPPFFLPPPPPLPLFSHLSSPFYVCLSVSVSLSLSVSIYVSVSFSVSLCQSVCLSASLSLSLFLPPSPPPPFPPTSVPPSVLGHLKPLYCPPWEQEYTRNTGQCRRLRRLSAVEITDAVFHL